MRLAAILLPVCAALLAGCGSKPAVMPVEGPGTTIHSYTERTDVLGGEPASEEELLDENRILARVNGEIITFRSLKAEYRDALAVRGPMSAAELDELIVGWTMTEVRSRLLLSAAKRGKVVVPKKMFEKETEEAEEDAKSRGTTLDEDLESRGIPRWEWERDLEQRLMVDLYFAMLGGAASPISPGTRALVDPRPRPSDVWGRYVRSREAFREKATARVGAIYFRWADFEEEGDSREEAKRKALEKAREVRKRIVGGEPFERLREEYQKTPILTAPIARGSRGDAVEEFAFAAEVGDVSEVIATAQSNFLVLVLEERRPAGIRPFDEVREPIEREFRGWAASLAALTVVSRLLRDSVIHPPHLKRRLQLNVQRDIAQALMELSL